MKKYISYIYKFKKPIIAVFILINLTAVFGLTQIKIKTDFNVFKIENSQYVKNFDLLEENFPSSDQLLLVCEYNEELKERLADFETFAQGLTGIKYVKGIESEISGLPIDLEELSPIKQSEGKEYAVITLFPNDSFNYKQLKDIEIYLKERDIVYYMGGDKYMQNKLFDYLILILATIPPFILAILFIIFRMQMKSIKATVMSVLPAGIAALWTLGFSGLSGNHVSILTVLAPIFTIIIGSADGLHFISHVQEHLEDGESMKESLTNSLKMVGVPMIITTLTSVAGFVALMFIGTAAIHDLAIYASIGITLAGIITFIMLPTINSMEKIDISKKKGTKGINTPFDKLFGLPSILIVAAIIIVSVFGIPKLKTEFNQLMMYKNYTEVAKNFDKIMQINDGTIPVFALFENGGQPLGEDTSEKSKEFTNALLESGHVTSVVSVNSIMDTIKSKLPPNMPAGNIDVSQFEIYSELANNNYNKIIIFPKDLRNDTIENIVSAAKDNEGIILAGTQITMYELNQKMIAGQKNSLLIAFGLVFICLIISLRKLLVSIIAMLPILFTTLFMFAFLGLSGISLNLFTATIFSITIGVGIDYAIHFTSIYQSYKKEGLSSGEAAKKAYSFSSRPIIANALGFSIGLSALMLSPLKVHLYVSSLMWVSMILSSVLSLSFLPTVLRKMK